MSVILYLLCVVAVSALVSCLLGTFVRSFPVAVTGGFVICELLFIILMNRDVASSSDTPELLNVPWIFAFFLAPIFLITSYACAAIMARLRRGKTST
jgi:hypothetical protein